MPFLKRHQALPNIEISVILGMGTKKRDTYWDELWDPHCSWDAHGYICMHTKTYKLLQYCTMWDTDRMNPHCPVRQIQNLYCIQYTVQVYSIQYSKSIQYIYIYMLYIPPLSPPSRPWPLVCWPGEPFATRWRVAAITCWALSST